VKCGAALEIVAEAPTPPKTFRPLKLKSLSPQHDSDIIPGRPPWMSIYAVCLGVAATASLSALGFRLLNGTLFTTYSNFLVVALILAACIAALPATIRLWQLRRSGLLLTLAIQATWIIAAGIVVYTAYNHFPIASLGEFFAHPSQKTLEVGGTVVAGIILILFAPIWIPAIFGRIRIRGGYSDRFEGIIISGLGIALIGAFLLMFLALPITIFQPSLFETVDLTWPVPGLLRLGLAGSIPVNLIFAVGLLLDQSRFQ
jgi:hypothetical protein